MTGKRTNFVIVHGAWTGGWSWMRVVDRLHDRGHRAFAPTLTGLCERSHLNGAGVDLDMHITDIVNEIVWKDRAWVDTKACPQPAGTMTQKLRVTGAYRKVPRKMFIAATGWDGFEATAKKLEREGGWTVHRLACGHDVPIDMPDELTALLEEAMPVRD